MAMLNTLDGVRDETGAAPTPWGRWTRQWVAEENRHGDLMNKYCWLRCAVAEGVRSLWFASVVASVVGVCCTEPLARGGRCVCRDSVTRGGQQGGGDQVLGMHGAARVASASRSPAPPPPTLCPPPLFPLLRCAAAAAWTCARWR